MKYNLINTLTTILKTSFLIFSDINRDENDKVTPLLIDSKSLNDYLLNPEGEFVLNLNGTAFHPDDYEDIEQQVTVKLVLQPLLK
jgi:hypothetical protein